MQEIEDFMANKRLFEGFTYFTYKSFVDILRDDLLEFMDSNQHTPAEMSRLTGVSKVVVTKFLKADGTCSYNTACKVKNFLEGL